MSEQLTPEQAEAMLERLSAHYKVPVMPVTRYCDSLRTWRRAQHDRATRLRIELFPGIDGPPDDPETQKIKDGYWVWRKGPELGDLNYRLMELRRLEKSTVALDDADLQIRKSNLLARLIYGGQKLRTQMCPEHKGEWTGPRPDPCPHGCGFTGWLPEP